MDIALITNSYMDIDMCKSPIIPSVSNQRPENNLFAQGYRAHKKPPNPQDDSRALGIGLLQGPTAGFFLASEVPLYISVRKPETLNTRPSM